MEKKRHLITVEVDEDTYKSLIEVAKNDDRPYGYIVRKMLKTFLDNQPNLSKTNLVGTGDVGA